MTLATAVGVNELVRGVAILLAGYDMVAIPMVVYRRTRSERRHVVEAAFALGLELLLFGRVMQIVIRWNQPVLWFGAPLTLAGAGLVAFSAWVALR